MQKTKQTTQSLEKLKILMGALPDGLIKAQLDKEWKVITKCLDDPQKNLEAVKKLQNPITRVITYKHLPVYEWLQKVINNKELSKDHKEFIAWYKKEYALISLKTQGIMQ